MAVLDVVDTGHGKVERQDQSHDQAWEQLAQVCVEAVSVLEADVISLLPVSWLPLPRPSFSPPPPPPVS